MKLETNLTHDDLVMMDALMEAGAKLEVYGPGIVKRLEGKFLTLRCGDLSPAQHLHLRGTYGEDYAAVTGGYAVALCPYSQEDLEGI